MVATDAELRGLGYQGKYVAEQQLLQRAGPAKLRDQGGGSNSIREPANLNVRAVVTLRAPQEQRDTYDALAPYGPRFGPLAVALDGIRQRDNAGGWKICELQLPIWLE